MLLPPSSKTNLPLISIKTKTPSHLSLSVSKPTQTNTLTNTPPANAVSRLDNLEFLTDVVPKTIPFKEIKSKKIPSSTDPTSGATETTTAGPLDNLVASSNGTNGNASGFSAINVVNGNGKTPAREDDDDPNAQLEMESRRRSGVSNGGGETLQDVEMS